MKLEEFNVEPSELETVREALRAAGLLRAPNPGLWRDLDPEMSIEEVRAALTRAAGPSLSDLIDEQRGSKD